MSLGKYRTIDLFILLLIMSVLELICWFALAKLSATFAISVCATVALIVIIRWNAWGLIHAGLGAVLTVSLTNLFSGNGIEISKILIYGCGNLAIALELVYVRLIGKQKIYKGGWYLVLYTLIGFLSICLGRTLVAVFFDNPFLTFLKEQIVAEALNFVFAIIILFITNRQDSVLRDQKEYFLEVRGRR